MLGDMVGVAVASRRTLVQFCQVFEGLPSLNPNRLGLSLVVVATILLSKKFAPKFPVSLIVVAASAWLKLSEHGFSVIGPAFATDATLARSRRHPVAAAPFVGGFAGSRCRALSMSSVLSTPILS